MSFAGKVWRLLVGIKDGLVLLFMLLFFIGLFAILSSRPSPGQVREGALLLELDGFVVEERSEIDPFQALLSQQAPVGEYEAAELVRAIDAAASDDRIKAVVLDLSKFMGGGAVHLQDIGEALARVRAADKPVFTHAIAYTDDSLFLASHASEVWLDPLGTAFVAGPGGSVVFFDGLLEKLKVNARIYRVGTHKAAVEPFMRDSFSEEARENIQAILDSRWQEWQARVKKARPGADLELVTNSPVDWVESANGDLAQAALAAGLVDKLGDRAEFGARVAEVVGEDDWSDLPGSFAATELKPWLADNALDSDGKAIGIITVAGDIVDGDAGPGTAGGERIANLLDEALDDELAALVVRVDSGGGSVLASEQIRRAIMRHKAKGIPVAVSFGNTAASGGYWVATPGDRIFAEPETVTGSIGVFGIIPTFEGTMEEIGVSTDRLKTTPLTGEPDILGGFTPEFDAIAQASVGDTYNDFISLVAKSRNLTVERVDEIGQGQVWDGGTARQMGLVDQFGGLDDAMAWAAGEAQLEEGDWHAVRLGGSADPYEALIRRMMMSDDASARTMAGGITGMVALRQRASFGKIAGDLERLLASGSTQAYCLACPQQATARDLERGDGWLAAIASWLQR